MAQEGLQHFLLPGRGYLAYALRWNGPPFLGVRTPVVLSDPVCDPHDWPAIAAAFLERHPTAMFAQVSAGFALVLRSLGLLVNSMGGETEIDLATYSFAGYAKRGLRSAIASAAKEGVRVEEVGPDADWPHLAAELADVDASWVGARAKHAGHVWFINRPPCFEAEPGVRKLVARSAAGRAEAFVFFDPCYNNQQVVGWYANVTRMRRGAHPGVLNLIISTFMDMVRQEAHVGAPPSKQAPLRKSLRKRLQAAAEATAAEAAAAGGHDLAANATAEAAAAALTSALAAAGASPPAAPSSLAGPRFLSLGLSPLYQMDNSLFLHSDSMAALLERAFRWGGAFYPFKSLAAAKAKYGAGYTDAAVSYKQVYLAHSVEGSAALPLFDFAQMVGFWDNPAQAAALLVSHKVSKGGAAKLRRARSRAPRGAVEPVPAAAAACAQAAAAGALHEKTASRSSDLRLPPLLVAESLIKAGSPQASQASATSGPASSASSSYGAAGSTGGSVCCEPAADEPRAD